MTPESAKALGDLLHSAREAKGLTLRAVAEQADMRWGHLARIERGDFASPASKYLEALSRVLDIPLEELLKVAGYRDKLPEFTPYLRAKYDLPDEAVEQLNDCFQQLQQQHARPKRKARTTKKAGGR